MNFKDWIPVPKRLIFINIIQINPNPFFGERADRCAPFDTAQRSTQMSSNFEYDNCNFSIEMLKNLWTAHDAAQRFLDQIKRNLTQTSRMFRFSWNYYHTIPRFKRRADVPPGWWKMSKILEIWGGLGARGSFQPMRGSLVLNTSSSVCSFGIHHHR